MTADRQKGRLKKKAQSNREKIKSSWSKNSGAQSDGGAHDRREKTGCRNDEKIAIHSKETYCKTGSLLGNLRFRRSAYEIREDMNSARSSNFTGSNICFSVVGGRDWDNKGRKGRRYPCAR